MTSVTTVVTYYDQPEYAPEAMASLARQSRLPDEVIVVDDGSGWPFDPAWVPPELRPRTTTARRPHAGVGAALNAAVRLMTGDILTWLPSDDLWMPEKLERQELFAEAFPRAVLHAFCEVVGPAGVIEGAGTVPDLTDGQMLESIRTSSPYYATTFWVPRGVLAAVGPFREDVPISEDYEWVLRSVVRHGVRYRLQPEVLAVKRRHENSLTARRGDEVAAWVARFNQEHP